MSYIFYQAERRGQSEGGIPEDFVNRLGIFKRRVHRSCTKNPKHEIYVTHIIFCTGRTA